jgi:hypothetical protein
MRTAEPWYVNGHTMVHEKFGSFFVHVYADGTATARRVWGKSPKYEHEWIGEPALHFRSADAAKDAANAWLLLLISRDATEPGTSIEALEKTS